jgi:hypothetical protein
MNPQQLPNHSPGPWAIDVDISGWMFSDPDEVIVAKIDNPDWYDDGAMPNNQTCEANARLIAAAPDLLAALQAVIRHYGTTNFMQDAEPFNTARAAIAKATGGQG